MSGTGLGYLRYIGRWCLCIYIPFMFSNIYSLVLPGQAQRKVNVGEMSY
jgi:hypothetical protein